MSTNAVPKPAPRETSRHKGGRQGGRAKHWKTAERECSRWLQDHVGVDPDPPVEPSSTGRVGHLLRYDATSRIYIGEVKERLLPKWFFEAWVQILQLALQRGDRHPVVLMSHTSGQRYFTYNGRRIRTPVMHILTPERHAELLRCEAEVRGTDIRIDKDDILQLIEAPQGAE